MFEELKRALFNENAEEHEGLQCDLCNKCLSAPPILYNNIYGNVCGRNRCNSMAKTRGDNFEQKAYESVAKYLVFPCMYRDNGCQEELKWNEVQEHEFSCSYKKLPCPFWQDDFPIHNREECVWGGSCSKLLSHIEEHHPDRISSNNLSIPFSQNFVSYLGEIFVTKIANNVVFILFRINDFKTTLYCKVWSTFHIYKDLKYRITILDENPKESITLRKRNVQLLSPNFLKDKTIKEWTKIDLTYLKDILNAPNSIVVEFEFNGIKLNSIKLKEPLQTDDFFDIGLRAVTCDKCRKELVPPVYLCQLAHNICFACKKNESCPRCSSFLSNKRNVAFEKLKFSVQQPCVNSSKGCTFRDTYPSIKEHELVCPINQRRCILGCSEKYVEFLSHLKVEHVLSMSELNVFYDMNRLSIHIFQFDNQVFLFKKSLIVEEGFSYTVQCLGTRDIRYKYKLYLINDKFAGSEIVLSQFCHPELLNFKNLETQYIQGLTNNITIPQRVLEQMLPDLRNLKFKICLYKIGTSEESC